MSDSIKERFTAVAWRSATGMRDKLSHEYWGVDFAVIWETIQSDLPVLKEQMREIYDALQS